MDTIDRERTWWLYERTLDEVRAQVDRGWTHTQFFILLNAGIAGAVLAFYGPGANPYLAALVLLGGAAVGSAGIFVLFENKRYYRTLALKRTALELHLGLDANIPGATHRLAIYALSPTKDAADMRQLLTQADEYVRPLPRGGSITGWASYTLLALILFDLGAALALGLGWV